MMSASGQVRIQTQSKYKGIVDCVTRTYTHEGVSVQQDTASQRWQPVLKPFTPHARLSSHFIDMINGLYFYSTFLLRALYNVCLTFTHSPAGGGRKEMYKKLHSALVVLQTISQVRF